MIGNFSKSKSGFAVLETLFYVALFAAISAVVIDAMLTMSRAFKETSIQSELMQAGNIMEKISREIKQAKSINAITASSLKLNTTDSEGADKTVEFALSGSDINFLEDNVLTGTLNPPNLDVADLSFSGITTATGSAVKATLSASSSRDSLNRTYDFFSTAILRGSY